MDHPHDLAWVRRRVQFRSPLPDMGWAVLQVHHRHRREHRHWRRTTLSQSVAAADAAVADWQGSVVAAVVSQSAAVADADWKWTVICVIVTLQVPHWPSPFGRQDLFSREARWLSMRWEVEADQVDHQPRNCS